MKKKKRKKERKKKKWRINERKKERKREKKSSIARTNELNKRREKKEFLETFNFSSYHLPEFVPAFNEQNGIWIKLFQLDKLLFERRVFRLSAIP